MQLENKQELLSLLRLGIGNQANSYHENYDWSFIHSLAEKQGLSAIILDGINCLPESVRPPKDVLLQWIGSSIQSYEYRYVSYQKAIAGLAGWYNAHGYKMMVLKGYACSLDWPKPNHRPCGDIDIWQFGQQREADAALEGFKFQDSSFKIDTSHHHHTVFEWNGFTVENHYDFVNVHTHSSSKGLEKIFKELGQDDSHSIEVDGEKVYIPSPNLHALFLLRHMASHFAAVDITLKQVLDWAFFVEKHTKEVDWEWLNGILEEFHMREFFNIINAICVDDLGFSKEIFPSIQFLPKLKERVLGDILSPEYDWMDAHRLNLIPRMLFKFRRWKSGAWKRKLCYKESDLETFLWGIRSHLLKPATI